MGQLAEKLVGMTKIAAPSQALDQTVEFWIGP